MEITAFSTEDTEKLAQQLASKVKPGSVLALFGDLGAGKTTFTRYLVKALGSEARVQSPTFVIARKYKVENNPNGIKLINHLDLYRLKTPAEVDDLDLSHFFDDPKAVTFIEWPYVAEKKLPNDVIKISFEMLSENSRKIYAQNID